VKSQWNAHEPLDEFTVSYDRFDWNSGCDYRISPDSSSTPPAWQHPTYLLIRIVYPKFSMATIHISAIAPNESVRKHIHVRVHLVEIETTNTKMIVDVAFLSTSSGL